MKIDIAKLEHYIQFHQRLASSEDYLGYYKPIEGYIEIQPNGQIVLSDDYKAVDRRKMAAVGIDIDTINSERDLYIAHTLCATLQSEPLNHQMILIKENLTPEENEELMTQLVAVFKKSTDSDKDDAET